MHVLEDKLKNAKLEFQECIRRRDTELLEEVVKMREGTGFGELAL
jgi:hypothetical protein